MTPTPEALAPFPAGDALSGQGTRPRAPHNLLRAATETRNPIPATTLHGPAIQPVHTASKSASVLYRRGAKSWPLIALRSSQGSRPDAHAAGRSIARRPFFKQGPSALSRLVFFSALALF